jgi:Uma2 family endonuclease
VALSADHRAMGFSRKHEGDERMIVPVRIEEPCYPSTDEQPMADNTLQFEWISILKWGLDDLFRDRPDVFVAGDNLIYPVIDHEEIRLAPDVYVAFGRPKGHRSSYRVWEEGGVFPQIVFEVWSPGNRQQQMEAKFRFYQQYGAEEYYIIYPERPSFVEGWSRDVGQLVPIDNILTWTSPRLGIRFELFRGNLNVMRPDHLRFLTYIEISQQLAAERARANQITAERDAERARAEQERERAERLAAKLRELGIDPDAK